MKLLLCTCALVASVLAIPETLMKTASDQFSSRMLQEVNKVNQGKSYVFSAFSVMPPLAELALASVGASHDEILRNMGFPNDDATMTAFTNHNRKLQSIQGVVLKQANKVYVNQIFQINSNFSVMSKRVFNTEVENIDVSQKEKAAHTINTWVEDHTNNRIKNFVDPNQISPETDAILVNAVYFKGDWKNKFLLMQTSDKTFHVTKDRTAKVPMMTQTDSFNYTESAELDAKILDMPLRGGDTSFVIVLPNKIDGINNLIENLKRPDNLNKALASMKSEYVKVSIPKFRIETKTNLIDVLKKMGITKLFSPIEANLHHLINVVKDISIGSATQKTFIDVNEEGVEAAAATLFSAYGSGHDPNLKIFNADHPFVFFLMENREISLFNGVYQS